MSKKSTPSSTTLPALDLVLKFLQTVSIYFNVLEFWDKKVAD